MNKKEDKVNFYKHSKYFAEGGYKFDKYPYIVLDNLKKDIYQIVVSKLSEDAYMITDYSTSFNPICRRVLFQSDNINECILKMAHKTNWLIEKLIENKISFSILDSNFMPTFFKLYIEKVKELNDILFWLDLQKDSLTLL